MPCYDPETHEAPIRLKKKLDHVTRLLCALCTAMENKDVLRGDDLTDLAIWWRDHKAWDAERQKTPPEERGYFWENEEHP